MQRLLVLLLLGVGFSAVALASPPSAPEIDPNWGASALALIASGLIVLRSGRKK
jgi:hypothetical protein